MDGIVATPLPPRTEAVLLLRIGGGVRLGLLRGEGVMVVSERERESKYGPGRARGKEAEGEGLVRVRTDGFCAVLDERSFASE